MKENAKQYGGLRRVGLTPNLGMTRLPVRQRSGTVCQQVLNGVFELDADVFSMQARYRF